MGFLFSSFLGFLGSVSTGSASTSFKGVWLRLFRKLGRIAILGTLNILSNS
jgi:hypothetical protein